MAGSAVASIRVRPETGKLQFDFTYRGVRCREQTALDNTPANRKLVESTLKRIEAEITLGSFDYARFFPGSKQVARFQQFELERARAASEAAGTAQAPTLSEFAERWFKQFEVTWRANHTATVRTHLDKHILPALGSRQLDKITRDDVLEFRAKLSRQEAVRRKRPLCAKTVNDIVGLLRAILTEASQQYGFVNPCQAMKRLKVQKKDIQPFTLEEVQTLIQSVRPDYRNYLTVRFFTGLRSGELHGLKWKYVDFDRRQILIRETWTHNRTEYTKTDGSQREVDMSQPVFDALKAQESASRHLSEYVFCNTAGGPLDTKNFCDRVWYPLLRHLDLPLRRPYQTRHTCATLWLGAGENPQWIARQLGHSTPEMLFRVYARFVPNLTRKDGSAFERLLQSSLTQSEPKAA